MFAVLSPKASTHAREDTTPLHRLLAVLRLNLTPDF